MTEDIKQFAGRCAEFSRELDEAKARLDARMWPIPGAVCSAKEARRTTERIERMVRSLREYRNATVAFAFAEPKLSEGSEETAVVYMAQIMSDDGKSRTYSYGTTIESAIERLELNVVDWLKNVPERVANEIRAVLDAAARDREAT